MAGPLDTYNAEIIATECPRCKRVGVRCMGSAQTVVCPQASHVSRRTAAGYRWNKDTEKLEKIA